MGCLLGCFGFKKKRKRLIKPRNKYLWIEQNHGSYVPLDSEVKTKLIGKLKNPTKIKKKVSFNLNVKAYEPIPYDGDQNYFSDGEEDNKSSLHYEEGLIESNIRNYRYQNCVEDEEDQFFYDENDLSFDYDDDEEEEDFYSSEEGDENEISSQDVEKDGDINSRAEGKRGNFYSVLNPVENLAQWKQVKARKAPITQSQKENKDLTSMDDNVSSSTKLGSSKSYVPKNVVDSSPCLVQDRGISVDASLSNWLK